MEIVMIVVVVMFFVIRSVLCFAPKKKQSNDNVNINKRIGSLVGNKNTGIEARKYFDPFTEENHPHFKG